MNKSSVTFGFSTLKTKSDRLDNKQLNDEQQKLADRFKNLEPKRVKTSRSKDPTNKALRDALVFSDNSNIQLLLWKKGKMLGKNVFRDVTLTRSGTELFQLSQEIHKKSYDAPTEFAYETKDEHKQKVANKADKKKLLAWDAKEISGYDFRITFRRAASTESDPAPDMAYYFKNREDWVKTRNYIKFIKLLESEESRSDARPNLILGKLEKHFQNVIKNQFRNFTKVRAETIRTETEKRMDEAVKNSEMLKNFDQGLVTTMKTSWSKYAEDSEAYKKEQERLTQERKEAITKATQTSTLLHTLDEEMMRKVNNSWKSLIATKYSKDRRDIQVYFNTLELAADVIQPSLKVEIKFRKDYPEIPTINGKKITNKFLEYQLYCQFQASRSASVNCWRITPTQRVPESPVNLQGSASPLKKPAQSVDDPFMLVFNDFRTEFIDCVEIKVILYDEISTIMGYYYAPLKSLYTVAEKGHSAYLCLKVNNEGINKFPLIHLRILSYLPNRNKTLLKAVDNQSKDFIDDIFYNYRFKIPAITPKHIKYLELLPDYWNIIDKKMKTKNKQDPHSILLVEAIRKNLFESYYQNTSRQIAHGTRSAYLWSELQDELMLLASQAQTIEENQLFVDCDSLRSVIAKYSLTETSLPPERIANLDNAVSYLYKRDQWDKKAEWVHLYEKLKNFCRKGIPPQYRISLWSELGKVVFFVELAEALLKRKRFFVQHEDNEGINFSIKARRVYEVLQRQSEEQNSYLYQSLEEDIEYLRKLEGKDVLVNERYLRKICKTFIAWSKLMSENATPAKFRYYVPYSREIVILCYGLVTCQTCRYIEGNTVVEEDQILWLLTSLSAYILSRYYQVNEDAVPVEALNSKQAENSETIVKSNCLTNSALRCNSIKGIKSDLLLLKLMLKETERDIYFKFEEFGVPLEYYFADHMLTLFVNLFNPGLTFRCWDVIFFEGSSADGANANKMIICIIYALLKDCKEQILRARTPDDLKFIIELYGRFETKYGNIIKKAYETFNTCLDISLKPNASVLDKLNHFKQIMFTDISRSINKAMSQTERQLESFYQLVHQQNQTIYNLLHPSTSLASDPESDLISYHALKKMISDFHSKFSNIHFKICPKNKTLVVSLKLHQILLNTHGNGKIALELSCGGKTIAPEQSILPYSPNFETKFEFEESQGIPRDLFIEIYSQEEPTTSQRIGYRTVNLESLLHNTVNKFNLQVFSDNLATKKNIPDISEIELSVFIKTYDNPEDNQNNPQCLIASELENPNYKNFRKMKLLNTQGSAKNDESSFLVGSPLTPKVFEKQQSVTTTSSPSYEIKQNFEINYQWFEKIVKAISPAWAEKVDLESIYNIVANADRAKKFFITNFFALLVLFGKLTLNQRVDLLFQVLLGYNNILSDKPSETVSSYIIKDLLTNLYEAFMIYIPQNEIENLADLVISGHTCFITKVTLNGTHKIKPDFPRQTLNRLVNFIHLYSGRKEIFIQSREVVKILKSTYEKDMSINLLEKANPSKHNNELKIYYTANGVANVYTLHITDAWEIIPEVPDQAGDVSPKALESLPSYQHIISLANQPKFVKKPEFVEIVKGLPMIDYLCSFDNLGTTSVLDTLKNPRFTVMIDKEVLYSMQPSFSPNIKIEPMSARSQRASPERVPKPQNVRKNKFPYYLENWDQVVERARFLKFSRQDANAQNRVEYDPQSTENQISFDKLNIYMQYPDIVKLLKMRIIKTASDLLDKSKDNIKHLNLKIFNRNLWKLDYKFSIKIDSQSYDVDLTSKTPFTAISELLDQNKHHTHKNELAVEIQVILQPDKYIHDKEAHPIQMAICTYPDTSREWLPCTVQFKYRYVDAIKLSTTPVRTDIDGYGIIYERFPKEIILKPLNEVLFTNKIDIENLELREIEKEIVPGQEN